MAEEASRSRLGRGLASLIGDLGAEANDRGRTQRRLPIELLKRNPFNPRRAFSEVQLDELAQSIRSRGIIQPLIVRPAGNDNYEIVAGERRWRAAQRAGLHDVPVVVVEVNDREAFQLAIIENVRVPISIRLKRRTPINDWLTSLIIARRRSLKRLARAGRTFANTLRLLKLTKPVQELITTSKLDAGHARILVGLDDQVELANLIVERGYSVRQVEAIIRERTVRTASAPREPRAKDANSRAFEKRLTDALGLQVTLNQRGDGGVLHIRYSNLDQLDDIARKLEGTR